MSAEIIVRTDADKIAAISAVVRECGDSTTPLLVVVREYKPNRSAAQNRLYWGWLTDCQNTDINEHAGNTKEEWAKKFKRLSLSKIYERDSEEYAATMAALREVWHHGLHKESMAMVDHVIRETSTTKASVEQFSEYLNYIEHYCHERGIRLKTDERLYAEAMGRAL